jgi:hypothetical protein
MSEPSPLTASPPGRTRRARVAVVSVLVAGAIGVPAAVVAVTHTAPAAVTAPTPSFQPLRPAPAVVTPNAIGDVDHLTPTLRSAIRRAMAAAAGEGVELRVTSGWRSRKQQQELYDEAVAKYGSPEVARQWVLPPGESAHVRGEAVDVGPAEGARWLETNGVRFGLCRRYANESWHFERLAAAKGSKCPPLEPHA